ncbi:hypothetical protein [Nonomuraea sp. NPDC050691]|uniref:hypothetical protein n=1 Tax=Nonomuraea sp. NPDC050691 TaxID=3155661 RepID=UPI0033D7EB07
MSARVSRRAVLAGVAPLLALAAASTPRPTGTELQDAQYGPPRRSDTKVTTPGHSGAGMEAEPWPGETQAVSGARSLVLGHRADAALLRDLAHRADTAGARVSAVLQAPVRPLVLVPASSAEAARLAGVTGVEGLAAMADGGRVVVVPEAFGRLTAVGRDVVLAHELTHVAAGTGGLPPWLYEGFADYVAYRDAGLAVPVAAAELAAEVRAGRTPGHLPGAADFAPGSSRLAAVYQEAWLACRFVAEWRGERTLVRLYRDARTRGADRALAAAGLPAARLTAGWRAYVREKLA